MDQIPNEESALRVTMSPELREPWCFQVLRWLAVVAAVTLLAACELGEERPPIVGPVLVPVQEFVALSAVPGTSYSEGTVVVRNDGTSELAITRISVEAGGSAYSTGARVGELPTIFAGETLAIPVRYQPSPETGLVGEAFLTVESTGGSVQFSVVGEQPDTWVGTCNLVYPTRFDFALELDEAPDARSVWFSGCSEADVTYRNLRIEPEGGPFELRLPTSFIVGQHEQRPAEIEFVPRAAGVFEAELVFESDVWGLETVRVPIRGEALPIDCLQFVAGCRQPGIGGALQSELVVPAGSLVECENITDEESDDAIISFLWQMHVRPAGSNASFVNPVAYGTTFLADVPGEYVAELVGTPEPGREMCGPAVVRVEAMDAPELGQLDVELSWEIDGGEDEFSDLDLHILRGGVPNGDACWGDETYDANWLNESPDWGASGPSNDVLIEGDLADPEEFAHVATPEVLGYWVGVNVVEIPEGVEAAMRVSILLGGELEAEARIEAISSEGFIEVYHIGFDDGAAVVRESIRRYESYDEAAAGCE